MIMITATVNSAGILTDPALRDRIIAAMPGVKQVVIAAHGWQTDADDAAANCAKFSAGLSPLLDATPRLVIGIEWPSVGEFYSSQTLADTVGQHAGATLIQACMEHADGPIEFVLIGHSFGCRVVCNSLCNVTDGMQGVTVKLVLLEAAFENNDLDLGRKYRPVVYLPTSILATTSEGDTALRDCFPAAERLMNWFASDVQAFGYAGPTDATKADFGPRLTALDITDWQEKQEWFSLDRHSQIYLPELFAAVAEFINGAKQ